jgi:hypothetical protein
MKNIIDSQVIKKVLTLIGWTIEDHNTYLYECAEKYLAGFISEYPQVQIQIMRTTKFWNWWRKHWELRDMEYLELHQEAHLSKDALLEEYKEIHDPRTLLEAIYLNGQVLEESFAGLIGEITKQQQMQEEAA